MPERDHDGKITCWVGSGTDITELREAQQKLEIHQEQTAEALRQQVTEKTQELLAALTAAQSADKLKTNLMSTVSHEFRSPLGSIIGFSNLLLNRQLNETKTIEYIRAINAEGRRLKALVDDFLDLQRLESGREVFKFINYDITQVVKKVIEEYQLSEDKQHILKTNLEPVPEVLVDPEQIRRVVQNLLSNAVKYSPDGGEINISLCPYDHGVLFSINDQGLGISADEIKQLFVSFYRSEDAEKHRIPGTGLGLAICSNIIESHHGRIWAESAGQGKGSTFYFALHINTMNYV
jgi:signal transduction histidine kinase